MEAKDKAEELVNNFIYKMFYLRDGYNAMEVFATAKQCALIAVDEILEVTKKTKLSPLILRCGDDITQNSETFYSRYWTDVKREIEKL